MTELTLHMQWPGGEGEPRDASDQERDEWVVKMQAELQKYELNGYFEAKFTTPDGLLELDATRHGSALAALWGAGEPSIGVATSLFLCGRRGEDDAAALKSFRENPIMEGADPRIITKIQAQNRPCVHIFWTNREWFENGHVVVAAMALAAAMMCREGKAGFEPVDKKLSPEEEKFLNEECERVMDVYQILVNDWVSAEN